MAEPSRRRNGVERSRNIFAVEGDTKVSCRISSSIGTGLLVPEDNSDQRYISMVDWWRFSVSDQKELVHSPSTDTTHIISSGSMRLLNECTEMRTLDVHASRLCEHFHLGVERLPAMRQQLVEFVNAKLLVSFESLSEEIARQSSGADTPPRIASLAIPTRSRPQVLKRCLDSYAECAKSYGRDELGIHVMDQSDAVEDQQANQQALESVKTGYDIHTHYWTPRDAESLLATSSSTRVLHRRW